MYPSKFDYLAPESLEEALAVLAERGDEVKILAGGQSLIPMMKLRFAEPSTLLDINRIPGLDGLNRSNGTLSLGSLVRHNDVVKSDTAQANHTVASAAPWIADPIVRNLGTVVGSLAHHDPEGDWASVMLACGAELVLSSSTGERVVDIEDFLVDMFTTSCQPNEMVTEVRVTAHTASGGGNYQKLERKVGDYATVGVATSLELDDNGDITSAGIALTSVYPRNLKVVEAEQALVGHAPSDDLFAEAGRIASEACDPASDIRGSATYKRHIVDVFTRRGLAKSLGIAQGGQS
ncbi:MAG: xanthine dehydrogenase family protein subunit M [Acidobacteria bacterium]|nr:xanthine dehydrogenase family protein subunit M [Acidobacteriota bacterium]TDI50198.1 MAG: xanthine dehydrogenase family protein subunit M [Acidobacteriota bacterium]